MDIKEGVSVKGEGKKQIRFEGNKLQMTQYGKRNHYYDNSSNPFPINGCKSEFIAYLFDKYDNDLKQNNRQWRIK